MRAARLGDGNFTVEFQRKYQKDTGIASTVVCCTLAPRQERAYIFVLLLYVGFKRGNKRLKNRDLMFTNFFFFNLTLKGAEDGAAALLELCHHSRAHKTKQGRFQGISQVRANPTW